MISKRKGQGGSGIIEVMAAVLVLAVGVLSFAGLQARALQATGDSYARSQAMAIAQDLAERFRLNRAAASTYVTTTDWPITTPAQSTLSTCVATTSTATLTCSPTAMATFDMNEIRYRAATLLPAGLVNMRTCQSAVATTMPLTCIYVSWDGTLPTAGASGQCATSAGTYAGSPNCIMLEVL